MKPTDGPTLPEWVPAAKACAPFDRRDVATMVVRCVEVTRGKLPNPDRCGTDSAPLIALWRKAGKQPPAEFAADFALVAEWARLSRDPMAARDIRAEGWDGGKDRHRDVTTLARQDRWASRLDAARSWEDAGRIEPIAAAASTGRTSSNWREKPLFDIESAFASEPT